VELFRLSTTPAIARLAAEAQPLQAAHRLVDLDLSNGLATTAAAPQQNQSQNEIDTIIDAAYGLTNSHMKELIEFGTRNADLDWVARINKLHYVQLRLVLNVSALS
jgi:hypothetical protein